MKYGIYKLFLTKRNKPYTLRRNGIKKGLPGCAFLIPPKSNDYAVEYTKLTSTHAHTHKCKVCVSVLMRQTKRRSSLGSANDLAS